MCDINSKVQDTNSKVHGVNNTVQDTNSKVHGVNNTVQVDDTRAVYCLIM